MESLDNKKRPRVDSDESSESTEVKRLREDLLSCLDESDPVTYDPGLDLFMKSFEEEISISPSPAPLPAPELGYLLEASDDELGLPPSNDVAEILTVSSDESNGLNDIWKLDEERVAGYDEFEFGLGFDEYQPLDGVFDYADVYDDTVSLWRPEAEPAV